MAGSCRGRTWSTSLVPSADRAARRVKRGPIEPSGQHNQCSPGLLNNRATALSALRRARYRFGFDRWVRGVQIVQKRDASDDLDAHGNIDAPNLSAGGQKVAGS